MIDQAIEPLLFDKSVNVATLVKRIENVKELKSSDVVKVVFDYNNHAMYFSRAVIPFVRDALPKEIAIEKIEFYKQYDLTRVQVSKSSRQRECP